MGECIELFGAIIGLLISTILFFIKAIKENKSKRSAQTELSIGDELLALMEEAEKFTNYSGEEKKAYVITRVKEQLSSKKIRFDSNKISEKIEELIQLSKGVNSRKKNVRELNELYKGDKL